MLSASKTIVKLKSFVEKGDFARILSDVELDAASSALRNAEFARDPRSQVWSAINHLETACSAIASQIRSSSESMTATPDFVDGISQAKYRYLKCLMTLCYAYLGEKELCEQTLEIATKEGELVNTDIGKPFPLILLKFPYALGTFVGSALIFRYREVSGTSKAMKYKLSQTQLESFKKDTIDIINSIS